VRFDSNVQDAELNVEEAHNEITKYDQDISCAHIFLPIFCCISGIGLLLLQPRN
jgi:hypothetical protein